jgi:hypothetical protein
MFDYNDMTCIIGPLSERDKVEALKIKNRLRNFRAKGLIFPIVDHERESPLEEQLFDKVEFCKAHIFSALADFGLTSDMMRIVLNVMDHRDNLSHGTIPNIVHRTPTELERAIELMEAGSTVAVHLYVAVLGNETSARFSWKHAPTAPHIVLPISTMLFPILNLKAE